MAVEVEESSPSLHQHRVRRVQLLSGPRGLTALYYNSDDIEACMEMVQAELALAEFGTFLDWDNVLIDDNDWIYVPLMHQEAA